MPEATPASGSQNFVRALERGLEILDFFCLHEGPLALTTIAAAVQLTPSTALRILATLENMGYIARDGGSKRYVPGHKLIRLAVPSTHTHGLRLLALPYMKELNALFGESVSIYVPAGHHRMCLQRVESTQPLREVVNIGDTLPLGVGGAGRLLVSWLEVSPKKESFSLPDTLSKTDMATIRTSGYAVGLNERQVGVYGVASPVFDWTGDIIGALSLSGPMVRFSQEALPDMIKAVMHTGRQISLVMGWKG